MKCPICGAEIGDDIVCASCGWVRMDSDEARDLSMSAFFRGDSQDASLSELEAEALSASGVPKAAIALIAIGIVLVAAIVGVVIATQGSVGGPAQTPPSSAASSAQGSAASSEPAASQESAASSEPAASSESAASQESSASADASKSASSASAHAVSSGSASRSSTSASAQAVSFDPACLDSHGNPTLFAVFELRGRELRELIESNGYDWHADAASWITNDGSLFMVMDENGSMQQSDVDKLAVGAVGSPAVYSFTVTGYRDATAALEGLAADAGIVKQHDAEGSSFALAHAPGFPDHLVVVTKTGENEHMVVVFTDEAIQQGLFMQMIGIDAGSTMAEVWKAIAAS